MNPYRTGSNFVEVALDAGASLRLFGLRVLLHVLSGCCAATVGLVCRDAVPRCPAYVDILVRWLSLAFVAVIVIVRQLVGVVFIDPRIQMNMNGINQFTTFGSAGSLNYQSVQFGYNFQNAPVTVYAGFDTLKYDTNIGSPFAPFDKVSGTLPGYSARAGVEFQPTSNSACHSGSAIPNNSPGASIATSICPCYPALLRLPSAVAANAVRP